MAPAPVTTRTACPYCGVGCGVLATPGTDGSVGIAGDPEHPANFGRLCSKGSALGETLSLDGRLLRPEIKGEATDWDTALDAVASGFRETIAEHGPDSVAIYGSGQMLTEDYYVANKLMKGFIGSANIDTNSRLCMASSVAGHKRAFGSDSVPGCYKDLELADLIVLVGSNLAWCHPVFYQRIVAAKAERPEMRIVLIDPRRTVTADIADLHLPIASDGDVALFTGLLASIEKRGKIERTYVDAHTDGFDDALAVAAEWTVPVVAEATDLSEAAIRQFYDWFAATERTVTVYSQGVNQSVSGTDKVNAIINCHLATNRIGRPGMGPFSVTGQPNAMGGREVGGLANMLAAHMDIGSADDRDRVQRFWDAPKLASTPGLKAVDLFDAIETGQIKAVWIISTNPVVSMPEADRARQALMNCPLVVVSDMQANTDTVLCADIRLPAAGWGEKSGTVTNSERRISRQRAFLPAPGEARPDWWIICEVAKRMGFAKGFDFAGPAEIFSEHAALSAFENNGRRDFDLSGLTGMTPGDYEALPPVQWPVGKTGTERLFADGRFFSPSQRASFVATVPPRPIRLAPGRFVLNTGRVRDHWHTMTRTGKTARLSAHVAEPFAEIHPEDAKVLGVRPAALVRIENGNGAITVRVLVTAKQRRGHVFVPMHWTDQFASAGRVDVLVTANTDPHSGQPALKMSSVAVVPLAPDWFGFAVCRTAPRLDGVDYWALAEGPAGYRIEMAGMRSPEDWRTFIADRFFDGVAPDVSHMRDAHSGRESFAVFDGADLVFAMFVSPEPVPAARQWAVSQLAGTHDPGTRTNLLAGRPGADMPDTGAIVCSCYSVGINTIIDAVVGGGCHTVEAVGAALKAGTNCGSCRAEIREIIHDRVQDYALDAAE